MMGRLSGRRILALERIRLEIPKEVGAEMPWKRSSFTLRPLSAARGKARKPRSSKVFQGKLRGTYMPLGLRLLLGVQASNSLRVCLHCLYPRH